MMSCYEVKLILSQLQDLEGAEATKGRVIAHLEECASCQNDAQELELVWRCLDDYQGIEPSPYFKPNFWRVVRQEKPQPTLISHMAAILSGRTWKLAALGAAMIAALAISSGIIPNIIQFPDQDRFDNQLLLEVHRLVNTDGDDPAEEVNQSDSSDNADRIQR